jgi:hypothetical protein
MARTAMIKYGHGFREYVLHEKVGFLENRCNTVKKADTVAQPLRERFQKLKTVVTTYVTPLKMQKLFSSDPTFSYSR